MSLRQMSGITLSVLVFISALSAVYIKHQSRRLFVELQDLQSLRDQMNVEWGQLQLEQSTLSTHGRIERIARSRLEMEIPATDKVVIVSHDND